MNFSKQPSFLKKSRQNGNLLSMKIFFRGCWSSVKSNSKQTGKKENVYFSSSA